MENFENKFVIPGYISFRKDEEYFYLKNEFNLGEIQLENQYFDEFKHIYEYGVKNVESELALFLNENKYLLKLGSAVEEFNGYFSVFDKIYTVTVLPTEDCNFRCQYCYEDHVKQSMDESLFEKVVDHVKGVIEKNPQLEMLCFNWFGGEPLLRYDDMIKLARTLKDVCDANQVGFGMGITTNGYLLDIQKVKEISSICKAYYQITLDGTLHDKYRVLLGGKPTFETILHKLVDMKNSEYDFLVAIRVNVSEQSVDNEPFYKQIGQALGNDSRFVVLIRQIFNSHKDMGDIDLCDSNDVYQMNVDFASKYGFEIMSQNSSSLDQCYASQRNSVVFRPTGDLVKCTVELNAEWNQLGNVKEDGFKEQYNKTITNIYDDEKCVICSNVIDCSNMKCLKEKMSGDGCDYQRRAL